KIDAPAARWDKLEDFGRTLSAMTIFPMTAASVAPPESSPCLEYKIYLFDSGPVEVQAILSPTLKFLPGRKLRYAASFDDQPPQIISALPEGRNRDNLPRDWETTVKDAVRISRSKHTLDQPGYHTLKIWMVDPGVVLEKIAVDCGGVKPSYLGPPESFHHILLAQVTAAGDAPKTGNVASPAGLCATTMYQTSGPQYHRPH